MDDFELDSSSGFDGSNGSFDFGDTSMGDFAGMNLDTSTSEWVSLLGSAGSAVVGSQGTNPIGTTVSGQSGATQLIGMGSMGALARGAAMLSGPLIAAIGKLANVLGVRAGASPLGYARKVYGMLAAWAARNPGVSLIGLLVQMGLTVEEAAHFIGWGATHRRRRRARGISGRDMKNARRTIRKITSMARMIGAACAHAPRARRKV